MRTDVSASTAFALTSGPASIPRVPKSFANCIAKAFALLYPASSWKRLGYDHPFGEDFYSLRDYVPMRYDRQTTLDAMEQVPEEVLREFYMMGDAESIIKMLERYTRVKLSSLK